MSSITSLRALLEDQKHREVELLKQLIALKNETIENPKIDLKIHNSMISELQNKNDDQLKSIDSSTSELTQTQQNLLCYQTQLQTCYNQYAELDQYRINLETKLQYNSHEYTLLQVNLESNGNILIQQAATISKQEIALQQTDIRDKEQQAMIKSLRDQVMKIRTETEKTVHECRNRIDMIFYNVRHFKPLHPLTFIKIT